MKPLYIRVSKRYAEKLRFSGQLSLGSGLKASAPSLPPPPSTVASAQKTSPPKSTTSAEKSQPETESTEAPPASNAKSVRQGNLPAGLRIVCKHLGKSRSASSAVAAAPTAPVMSRRRDDSLLQQQDGIQSAILHCKRSFNASRGTLTTYLIIWPTHSKLKNCEWINFFLFHGQIWIPPCYQDQWVIPPTRNPMNCRGNLRAKENFLSLRIEPS